MANGKISKNNYSPKDNCQITLKSGQVKHMAAVNFGLSVTSASGIHTLTELEADAATWADKNLFLAIFSLETKDGRTDATPGTLLNAHISLFSTKSRSWLLQRVITNVVYISDL
jgi:phage protein D